MSPFFVWFFKGQSSLNSARFPGYKCLLNKWTLFHISIAMVMVFLFKVPIAQKTAPVCFTLAGGALAAILKQSSTFHSLIQTEEIKELMDYHPGGYEFYSNNLSLTLYIAYSTAILWGLAVIIDPNTVMQSQLLSYCKTPITFILYFLLSLSCQCFFSFTSVIQNLTAAKRKIEILKQQLRGTKGKR